MGKTNMERYILHRQWKHPHMHGEDYFKTNNNKYDSETPPHAWGRLSYQRHLSTVRGNTPTCMGKTRPDQGREDRYRKHPHMHGEDTGIYWALRALVVYYSV